jgi:hypothetical protein
MSQITTFLQPSGPGSGTVTSVSGGVGINITGVPTINPTVNLDVPVVIANGGTNAITFANTFGVVYFDGTRLVDTTVGTSGYTLTSNGVGLAPTFQATPAAIPTSFATDAGTAIPALNILNILGAHGINTAGSGNTVTVAINNAITLGDLSSIIGSSALTATTGDVTISAGNLNIPNTVTAGNQGEITVAGSRFISSYSTTGLGGGNTFVGGLSGNTTLTGNSNTCVGYLACPVLTSGLQNTALGLTALFNIITGDQNVAIGDQTLFALTSGLGLNTAVGSTCLTSLVNGVRNLALGLGSGNAYTTNESDNIPNSIN